MIETDAKTLDAINRDRPRYDRMMAALKDGHKPSPSELNAYHQLVEEFGRRSSEAREANDKFSERYYGGMAQRLNEEAINALKREKQKLIPKD